MQHRLTGGTCFLLSVRLGGVFLVVAIIGFQVRLLRRVLRGCGFHGTAKKGVR